MKEWRIYEFESVSALYMYYEASVSYLTPSRVWSVLGFFNVNKDALWINVVKAWNNFQKYPVKKYLDGVAHECVPHISLVPKEGAIEYLIEGVSFYSYRTYEELVFDMKYEQEVKNNVYTNNRKPAGYVDTNVLTGYTDNNYNVPQCDIDEEFILTSEIEAGLKLLTA